MASTPGKTIAARTKVARRTQTNLERDLRLRARREADEARRQQSRVRRADRDLFFAPFEVLEPKRRAKPKPKVVTKIVVRAPDPQQEAVAALPAHLRAPVGKILRDPDLNLGVREMMARVDEFGGVVEALLAGIGIVPEARRLIDDHLDATWAKAKLPAARFDELIVGGGLQAAIYAATRVKMGFPMPLVLEARERVGGVFAISKGPSFYLNSRNRPGRLMIPGEKDGSLNFLPNGAVQPSHLSGDEFQTNDVMAWAIRLTLALNARVVSGQLVTDVSSLASGGRNSFREARVYLRGEQANARRRYIKAGRVILADGLSNPRDSTGIGAVEPERILNFERFMERMDSPFPLRGFERVAVLGGGDAGRTAIESLVGMGPTCGMSVAALDFPKTIYWYGAPWADCATWKSRSRSRYARLGGVLPKVIDGPSRVTPRGPAQRYGLGYDSVLVDEVPFDYLIDCTGYVGQTLTPGGLESYSVGSRAVAVSDGGSVFRVGVASNLALTEGEQVLLSGVAENSTSAFRYASRTATLAAALPAPQEPTKR